jgi:hypothetical protein
MSITRSGFIDKFYGDSDPEKADMSATFTVNPPGEMDIFTFLATVSAILEAIAVYDVEIRFDLNGEIL